jgi:hypothetical protein
MYIHDELDDAAEAAIEAERQRLYEDHSAMGTEDDLPW